MAQSLKICTVCGIAKSLGDFYRNARSIDGKKSACRQCGIAASLKWGILHPESRRVINRRYREKHRTLIATKKEIYYTSNSTKIIQKNRIRREHWPDKYLARTAVQNALVRGDIIKAPCFDCGSSKVEAHHIDYSRPLAVEWLCRPCHAKRHRITLVKPSERSA